MARTSEFDGMIHDLLTKTNRGLTTREISEQVGSSAQKAFVYVREHKDELREMGKDERGAMTYVGVDNPLAASGKAPGKRGRGRPKGSVNKAKVNGSGSVAVAPKPTPVPATAHTNGTTATVTPIRKVSAVEVGVVMTLVRLVLDDGVQVTWEAADGRQITGTLNV